MSVTNRSNKWPGLSNAQSVRRDKHKSNQQRTKQARETLQSSNQSQSNKWTSEIARLTKYNTQLEKENKNLKSQVSRLKRLQTPPSVDASIQYITQHIETLMESRSSTTKYDKKNLPFFSRR